jgi:hypothetical protein
MDTVRLWAKHRDWRWKMIRNDREYFEARAEAELKIAEESDDPAVVQAHCQLAELHLERAEQCALAEADHGAGEKIAALG